MSSSPPRILVADDDDDVRTLVALRLRRAGYEVREASDGAAALDGVRGWRPDLALLDITMPRMTGLDVLREVRRDAEVSETRVVLLTGLARGSDRSTGLDAGADEYVFKPFRPSDILSVVAEVLER